MTATLEQLSSLTGIIRDCGLDVRGECYSVISRLEFHIVGELKEHGDLIGKQEALDACLKIEII